MTLTVTLSEKGCETDSDLSRLTLTTGTDRQCKLETDSDFSKLVETGGDF